MINSSVPHRKIKVQRERLNFTYRGIFSSLSLMSDHTKQHCSLFLGSKMGKSPVSKVGKRGGRRGLALTALGRKLRIPLLMNSSVIESG